MTHPAADDPQRQRVFVVVSQQVVIDSRFATVICVPLYSLHVDLASQVPVGAEEGLKHPSSIYGDELISLPKARLTNCVGVLSPAKIRDLNEALKIALSLDD